MNHHKTIKKFGRLKNLRNALMKSMASSLILKEKIRTTETKAKALRPFVEKIVTMSKKANLASRRLVVSRVGEEAGKKVVDVIAPKYKSRNGGYTRITKLNNRKSDGSSMAEIEFV